MTKFTKTLTIFEGPDGGGKSTFAKKFAERYNARYVHFGSMLGVHNLSRMYVEAMLPALLGYQDVVFDRSWLSEEPYAIAYRNGHKRLIPSQIRLLERLAMKCGAVVVRCQPEWEVVKHNFINADREEYLDNVDQLRVVYNLYVDQKTDLPSVVYDYTMNDSPAHNISFMDMLQDYRMPLHPVDGYTAGNIKAKIALVVSKDNHYDGGNFYQWPGCHHINTAIVGSDTHEYDLLWLGVNDVHHIYDLHGDTRVIPVGNEACEAVYKAKILTSGCSDAAGLERLLISTKENCK